MASSSSSAAAGYYPTRDEAGAGADFDAQRSRVSARAFELAAKNTNWRVSAYVAVVVALAALAGLSETLLLFGELDNGLRSGAEQTRNWLWWLFLCAWLYDILLVCVLSTCVLMPLRTVARYPGIVLIALSATVAVVLIVARLVFLVDTEFCAAGLTPQTGGGCVLPSAWPWVFVITQVVKFVLLLVVGAILLWLPVSGGGGPQATAAQRPLPQGYVPVASSDVEAGITMSAAGGLGTRTSPTPRHAAGGQPPAYTQKRVEPLFGRSSSAWVRG